MASAAFTHMAALQRLKPLATEAFQKSHFLFNSLQLMKKLQGFNEKDKSKKKKKHTKNAHFGDTGATREN